MTRTSSRTGEKNEGKTKPINLVLVSGHDRYKLMKYLVNLRGKPQYKKISTTEDFTVFERSKIRDWAKKSQRTSKEPKDSPFVWRVRGQTSTKGYIL